MTENRFYILLFVLVVIQISGLHFISNKIPNNEIEHIATSLKQMKLDIQDLRKEQKYSAFQYDGTQTSYPQASIERSIEEALANVIKKQKPDTQQTNSHTDDHSSVPTPVIDQNIQIASAQQVQTVMNNAALTGYWTEQDTESLLPHLGNLSQQQRNNLISQFMDAVENKGMHLNSPPPPL